MSNNRMLILFALIVVIAGAGLFWLYKGKETEHNLRVQKELELTGKMAEIGQLQNQLNALTQQKKEVEDSLNAKIETLSANIKDYEESVRVQTDKVNSLLQDNDRLKKDKDDLSRRLDELSQKIVTLEKVKRDLAETAKKEVVKKREQPVESSQWSNSEDTDYKSVLSRYDSQGNRYATKTVSPLLESEAITLGRIVIQSSSGDAATVQSINKLYGFIVINAGIKDGLMKDAVVNVLRDRRLIGKAIIEKSKNDMSAAVLLPEWTREEVRIGDTISTFPPTEPYNTH